MTRALVLLRLSRLTDASTSPERQENECRTFCAQRAWDVVGVATDLDVSGSTDPLTRTGSGPWLRDRTGEFDVVVAAKPDRFGRSTTHVHGLFQYLRQHDKHLYTADGAINTAGPAGELILFILAWAAQMELESITARNSGAAQHNIMRGVYRGGIAPLGYRSEKVDDHHELVPDEDGLAPEVRKMVSRLLDGDPITRVVGDLNERKVLTQKDRQAVLNKRPPRGTRWSISNLTRQLTSPTLIGLATHRPVTTGPDGKAVHDAKGRKQYGTEQIVFVEGAPLQRATPLIDAADYYRLQKIIESRKEAAPTQRRKADTSLLLHVLYCAKCGEPYYYLKARKHPRYRCASVKYPNNDPRRTCSNGTVLVSEAERVVNDTLLQFMGETEHHEKVFEPGEDNSRAIDEIDAQLETLTATVSRLPVDSPAFTARMREVDNLTTRRTELAAVPSRPSGFRYVPTGILFGQYWAGLDSTARNAWLRGRNVRVLFDSDPAPGKTPWNIEFHEMVRMFEDINPDRADATRSLFETVKELPDGHRFPHPSGDGRVIQVVHPSKEPQG
ncbi:recombinase family protein [Pseudonocardia abyssalis]|uniref:Recombinase family protein n=1 Tax=Pseudonocardia abyssalis TaxID=2792008 RepID=A0ABS6UXI6_9PSEU|nr:recombinase family protein [Pseudonocardia abyssalis]MBW0114939.1 recombinase family protein [Pseudonocardia abyssalis]MBW0136926.1 recombinase family protein [Pseudonocardia abyssalis]